MFRTLWATCIAVALLLGLLLGVVSLPSRGSAAPTSLAASPSAVPLRVLSWNIGKMHWRWDSRAADADLPHIARVIAAEAPDVVALQELRDGGQLRRLLHLLERTSGLRYHGGVAHEQTYDRRVGLLVRGWPARFQTITTSSGRTALSVRLQPRPGVDLVVVSVHVDAFEPLRRREQVEEILGWARVHYPEREVDLLAVGDFNLNLTGNPVLSPGQREEGSGLWRAAIDERLHRMITRHFVDLGPSQPTSVLGVRLDYVFARAPRLRSPSLRVLAGARINFMDHNPVCVDLKLETSGPVVRQNRRGAMVARGNAPWRGD